MTIFCIDIGRSSIGLCIYKGEVIKEALSVILPGESAVDRRAFRQSRRKTRRTGRLLKRVWSYLQERGLLPKEKYGILAEKARKYAERNGFTGDPVMFYLRKTALDRQIPLFILGIVLYNLVHHRGFYYELTEESNGKTAKASDDLAASMAASGARTMGEYAFLTGKHIYGYRSRGREHKGSEPKFFSHSFVRDEFDQIISKQSEFYPNLEGLKDDLADVLFRIRPFKTVANDLEWVIKINGQVDELPPVVQLIKNIRNPVVTHVLSELRRLCNTMIRRWGLPDEIRIETANGGIETQEEAKTRIDNKLRNVRTKKILESRGEAITPRSIKKHNLLEDQKFVCPLCLKNMGAADPVDLCHIIPDSEGGSLAYENTFVGHRGCNTKQPDKALYELPNYPQILAIIDSFGDAKKSKIARLRREEWSNFVASALTDTRTIVKLAQSYLGMLGRPVKTINGHMTATFRKGLGFEKDREDNRHHTLDAALLMLSQKSYFDYKKTGELPLPWPSFKTDVTDAVKNAKVIHRPPTHQLRGALHAATLQGKDGKYDAVLPGNRRVKFENNYSVLVGKNGKRIRTLSLFDVAKNKSLAEPIDEQLYIKTGNIFRRRSDDTLWRVTSLKRTSNQISLVSVNYGGKIPTSTVKGVREQPSIGTKFWKEWTREKSDY